MDKNEIVEPKEELPKEESSKKKSKIPYIIGLIIIAVIFYNIGNHKDTKDYTPDSTPSISTPAETPKKELPIPTADESAFIVNITRYADEISQGYGVLQTDIDYKASDDQIIEDCLRIKNSAQSLADLPMPVGNYVTESLYNNINKAGTLTVDGINIIINGLYANNSNSVTEGLLKLVDSINYLKSASKEMQEIQDYIKANK